MYTIIFDIDGTLADITHRLHHIKNGNKNWDAFHAECVNDKPVEPICMMARFHHTYSYPIILVSGRSDIVRAETVAWLAKHQIGYLQLLMRKHGDYRPDDILKEEFLDKLLAEGHKILYTVDDRQRVVDMWRRRGITCLQCAAWEEE